MSSFVHGGGRYGTLGEEGFTSDGMDDIEDGSLRLRVSMGGIDMDDIVVTSYLGPGGTIGKRIEYLDIDPLRISGRLSFVNLRLFVIPPLPGVLECAYTQTMNEDSVAC